MLINIENVSYIYRKNKLKALKNIDLKFSEHQTHAVLGHNGAGKTTLFLLMSGYLKLQSGRITYNSKFIDNKKEIAYVPESGGFFGSLTVWENLRFRYLISEQPEQDMHERINLLIETFGLDEKINMQGKSLSTGLKKRLALACAFVHKPKILLLDEPTNGIDPTTYDMLVKILNSQKKKGHHILFNSHDLVFVSEVADDISILNQGKVVCHQELENLDIEQLKQLYFENTESFEDERYEDI